MSESESSYTPESAPGPASEVNWVGKVLSHRYRISQLLGSGGMGSVYHAHDETLKRDVVVKVPHAQLLVDPGFRRRFQHEIRQLTKLSHPNIVKVLDAGEYDGSPFAVLEHLPGKSLADRLVVSGGKQSLAEVSKWLAPAASALDFVHKQDVIHRDIKPGNILFDGEGHVFLADFGIAKALGAQDTGLTQTGVTPGSPAYMAPEVATANELNSSYDQYSLAVLVYEALSGVLPIDAPTPIGLIIEKTTKDPPDLSTLVRQLPTHVTRAVMRGLARDPEARFPSCSALAEAILRAPRPSTTAPRTASAAPLHRNRRAVTSSKRRPRTSPNSATRTRTVPRREPKKGKSLIWIAAGSILVASVFVWFLFFREMGNRGASEDPSTPIANVAKPADPVPATVPKGARGQPPTNDVPAPATPKVEVPTPVPKKVDWSEMKVSALRAAKNGEWSDAEQKLSDARKNGMPAGEAPKALINRIAQRRDTPRIVISSPKAGATVEQDVMRVSGCVTGPSENATVTATLRGQTRTASVSWDGRFHVEFPNRVRGNDPIRLTVSGKLLRKITLSHVVHFNPREKPPAWARVSQLQLDKAHELGIPVAFENKFGMRFVLIPPGTFMMGSPKDEPYHDRDERQFKCTLTKPFYLQVTEMTKGQFAAATSSFVDADDRDTPHKFSDYPRAESIADRLNEMQSTHRYSLPSEAQWEFACRAGSDTPFSTGASIDSSQANFDGERPYPGSQVSQWRKEKLVPAGSLAPNAWGLHEMHGNLWEWCRGWYGAYPTGPATDPESFGDVDRKARVLRGGSEDCPAHEIRSASRSATSKISSRATVRLVAWVVGKERSGR